MADLHSNRSRWHAMLIELAGYAAVSAFWLLLFIGVISGAV